METLEQRKARRKAAAAEKRQAIKAMRETWEKAPKAERVTAENALYLAAREYTEKNRELLAMQCHARGLHVTKVQSASKWRAAGRKVRKGEKALMLYAPVGEEIAMSFESESAHVDIKKPKWYKLVPVFDISQTEPAEATSTREKTAPAPVQRETVKSAPKATPAAPAPEPETAGDLFAWQPAFAAIG